MIAQIRGKIIGVEMTEVLLDVNGVGYHAFIPLSTFDVLPRQGEETTLLTYMNVREDAIQLFGFATKKEKMIFELLITVNGIGAKTALNILSSMNMVAFCEAIASGDVKALKRINGVGPKSAERMIIELRDKIDRIVPELAIGAPGAKDAMSPELDSALLALDKLGFQRLKIQKMVAEVAASLPEGQRSTENIIRKALQALNK